MQLSELVAYRRNLDEITMQGGEEYIRRAVDPVVHSVINSVSPRTDHVSAVQQARATMLAGLQEFERALAGIKHDVDQEIEQHQPAYLARSYGLYEDMQKGDSTEHILDRRIQITDQIEDFVLGRIRRRDTWQHPALLLRPGLEPWIDHMVAFDPLYVADERIDLMIPAQSRFNEIYQNRVRWIAFTERDDEIMLAKVPDDQIGFCLAWNFFHYKPFEVIRHYLSEIYQKLRPGGIFAFSINDGDRPGGVANAERMWMCYTSGSMIAAVSQSMGFNLELKHEIDAAVTWIELVKPGHRASLRGGQALAKVIPKK